MLMPYNGFVTVVSLSAAHYVIMIMIYGGFFAIMRHCYCRRLHDAGSEGDLGMRTAGCHPRWRGELRGNVHVLAYHEIFTVYFHVAVCQPIVEIIGS